jgi:hypothetical protein
VFEEADVVPSDTGESRFRFLGAIVATDLELLGLDLELFDLDLELFDLELDFLDLDLDLDLDLALGAGQGGRSAPPYPIRALAVSSKADPPLMKRTSALPSAPLTAGSAASKRYLRSV